MDAILKPHKMPIEAGYEIPDSDVEHALHMITMAEEFKQRPELMKRVQVLASKRHKTVKSIADLKAIREHLAKAEAGEELPSKVGIKKEKQPDPDAADEEIEARVEAE